MKKAKTPPPDQDATAPAATQQRSRTASRLHQSLHCAPRCSQQGSAARHPAPGVFGSARHPGTGRPLAGHTANRQALGWGGVRWPS